MRTHHSINPIKRFLIVVIYTFSCFLTWMLTQRFIQEFNRVLHHYTILEYASIIAGGVIMGFISLYIEDQSYTKYGKWPQRTNHFILRMIFLGIILVDIGATIGSMVYLMLAALLDGIFSFSLIPYLLFTALYGIATYFIIAAISGTLTGYLVGMILVFGDRRKTSN